MNEIANGAGKKKAMEDLSGQQIGSYKLTKLLGAGGFAQVYLGEHVHSNSQAAVKILNDTHRTQKDSDRFKREAQIMGRLKHEHIVRIFNFDIVGGIPLLAMEYAPDGTLRNLSEIPVPLDNVADYVNQVAEALQYAHDKHVIHRDIKPENLLRGSQNEVLLSDFGIAVTTPTDTTSLDSITRQITEEPFAGTIEYMAPEHIMGNAHRASDQYSLGIVIYEWLCGTRPFQGDRVTIARQHIEASPPHLCQHNPAITPAIEEVVLRTLQKKPELRYDSIAEFNEAFQKACKPPVLPTDSESAQVGGSTTPGTLPSVASISEQPPVAPTPKFGVKSIIIAILLAVSLTFPATWVGRSFLVEQSPFVLQPSTSTPTCLHTLLVTTDQDNNTSGSFRQVVDKAQNGDCITFEASIKSIVLTSGLDIKHSITIQGNGLLPQQVRPSKIQGDTKTTPTIGNGTNNSINISIFPNTYVTFINLSFEGSLTFLDTSLISNQSRNLNIISCSFHGFHSHYTGSVISNIQGNVTLKDSYLMGNYAQSDGGGAIFNQGGTLTLDHTTVTSNFADYSGGGIYNVGGNVYLKNQSSLNGNQLGAQDANQGGGGGGIISRGGSIAISDSEIINNSASGDGGGVFLVDASAQIISSTVKFNKAPSQKGEDIAVEADLDNGQHNYLFIDPSSSSKDIWGKVDQKDPRMVSSQPLSTRPGYDPTKNNPQFVGSLTAEQFRAYCHQLNKSFTDVIMSTDAKSIQCISGDNTASNSFSDLHVRVIDVCAFAYSRAPNLGSKEHILARLASYWDPSSWQCFGNEQQKDTSITKDLAPSGKTWLDVYCQTNYGKRAFLLPLSPDKQTGYQWKCTYNDGSSPQRINMSEACKEAYRVLAVDYLVTFTDPYSWYCWVPISTN